MKKSFILLMAFFIFASRLSALPGFTSFISDQSGEYVYYKDSTFSRESYIGILCYDSETFQIRYFAPKNSENPTEKTVASLFTINSEKSNFEMTGENVFLADYSNPEDVDIINYMHDILYEFSKRRIKIGDLTPETEDYKKNLSLKENGLTLSNDYPQFGGDVYITYDVIIPFFNIKKIEDSKGKSIFECVRIGKINSSEDTSFDFYKPVPEISRVKINGSKQKKAKSIECKWNNQKITLDESWNQMFDNFWSLNDDAVITLSTYTKPKNVNSIEYMKNFLIRMLIESKDGYSIDFNNCDVIYGEDNSVRIYSENYMNSTSKVYYGIKYLTLNSENDYDFVSFAATKANYLLKRSYYNNIMKSYSN